MRLFSKAFVSLAAVLCVLAAGSPAFAQTVTTGSISGVISDTQGGVLPGATVAATHTPTGTVYEGVTDAEGRFTILNMRVGPYDVKVVMSGFREETLKAIDVRLGETTPVIFKLQVATITETVDVRGDTTIINANEAGAAGRVSNAAIEALPTISRSLTDMARVSPYFNPVALNEDPLSISVAGRNNRYNNVQIDGAVNNDVFGLAPSGTPGGQTETQPISLDAIQELQLVVSPYDVRQGGFSGGGVNAITRSGSNSIKGTAYYFGRNQDLVGEGVSRTPIAQFNQKQFGVSVGGPIAKNKAFFFGNGDFDRRDNPSGFSVSTSGQTFGREAEIDRFLSILNNIYGYNPGGKEEFIRTIDSDKFFGRVDFNLSSRHQLVARHNLNDSANDIGRPTAALYILPDNFYQIKNRTNSSVVQLNSTFGSGVNEARFTLQRIRDRRAGQPFEERAFPNVTVDLSSGQVRAGRENFSTANELDQDVYELSDDFTWMRGNHTLTLGTKNEFFKFRNLFIRNSFGTYRFANLDLFEQGLAGSYDYDFSLTADPLQSARFRVRQFGFYAGDQWRAASNLTLTMGVRADIPTFPDKPTYNPQVDQILGRRTDEAPTGILWSPRIGFNYSLSDANREQVRGGFGVFAGRTPYVWLSNQYGSTGMEFQRLSRAFSTTQAPIPFVPDASNQPRTVGGVATNEINLIDPDYKYPSLMRGNLAYDRELPWGGVVATAEFLYSQNVNDVKYRNLNITPSGATRTPDGRIVYQRPVTSQFSNVIDLTNTDQGDAWSIAFKLERPFRNRFFANVSYLYGESTSILDGTSSQATSNWSNVYNAGDINNPPVARSNFDPGHRFTASGSYEIPVPAGFSARVAVYYSGQSGRPWSPNFNGDVNNDGISTSDLLYLPTATDSIVYSCAGANCPATVGYGDLLAFMNAEQCLADQIGTIAKRNSCRSPWQNTLDMKFNFGLPVGRTRVEFSWDILNVLNLMDADWGVLRYANFNDLLIVRPVLSGNQINYNLQNLFVRDAGGNVVRQNPEDQFTRADLLSRWQMQWGVRFRF